MPAGGPRIEVADDRNTGGIWRPHRKSHAADAVDGQALRAKAFSQLQMPDQTDELGTPWAQALDRGSQEETAPQRGCDRAR